MFEIITQFFSYSFLCRAVISGVLVALCAALLGVGLVLKKYSMIGDGLSHVAFGAMAVATAANLAPLKIAIPVVIIAAFLLLRISENSKLKGDSVIALISTGALAVGVMAVSLTTGMNVDVYNYMFGSILSVSGEETVLSVILCLIVLIFYIVLYNRIFAITFDETFARASGIKAGFYNMFIAALTAVTVVLGMKLMGALLISALIIFPSLTAMRVFKTFKTVTVCAGIISVVSFIVGIILSYSLNTPAGAGIVCVNIIAFGFFSVAGYIKSKILGDMKK